MLKIDLKKNYINKRTSTDLKYLNDSEAFSEYSNDMCGIYKNTKK